MQKITNKAAKNLKLLRKITRGKITDLILIEGSRLAEETLRSKIAFYQIFFSQSFLQTPANQNLIERLSSKTRVFELGDKLFDSLSNTKNSQGILLVCERPETGKDLVSKGLEHSTKPNKTVLMLDGISNPGNLGAIFRVAEAAAAAAVIITKNSADAFSAKTNRSALGANLRIPVWEGAEFGEVLSWAEKNGLRSVCADVSAKEAYTEIAWDTPSLLIFGSEAHGLSAEKLSKVDKKILIPMANEVESLNIAVSCGVIMFEAKRQSDPML